MSERTGTQILESIERLAEQALSQQVPASPLVSRKKESEDLKELYKSLSLAQEDFLELKKSGFIAGRNTPYAKLSDLVDASIKALHKHGLVCHTRMITEQGITLLISRLVHCPTGQYIESELPLLNNTDEQKRGSSITYAWRYTYAPLIGLVDSSYDDDGESTKIVRHSEPASNNRK